MIRIACIAALGCAGIALCATHASEARTNKVASLPVTQLELRELKGEGAASQGIALGKNHYFGSDNRGDTGLIHRFDTDWNYVDTHEYKLPGVNHIGALSIHDGFLWTGFLNSKGPRKSIVAKINASDLTIAAKYDITADATWIDPVCFDGKYVWVGDMSDMGIHQYHIEGEQLIRAGILRYPRELHFSQGIQVRNNKLYSMHTFGDWDGLAEFDIAQLNGEEERAPIRVWAIPESRMRLEGFDFIPGVRAEIWHAQGQSVERIRLLKF